MCIRDRECNEELELRLRHLQKIGNVVIDEVMQQSSTSQGRAERGVAPGIAETCEGAISAATSTLGGSEGLAAAAPRSPESILDADVDFGSNSDSSSSGMALGTAAEKSRGTCSVDSDASSEQSADHPLRVASQESL